MTTRTCRKCGETKPITDFPTYRAKGYEGVRRQCRDCIRAYRTRWEMELSGERERRYQAVRSKAEQVSRRRRSVQLEQAYRERRSMLRGLVTSLHREGLTNAQIADMAGVSARTIRRIMSDEGDRRRFYEPVEEKILALYSELKGIRP